MSLCEDVSQGVTETVSLIALKTDSEPALGDICLQPANSSVQSKSDTGGCTHTHRHTGDVSKVSCAGRYYRRVSALAVISVISVVSIRY